jgi:hypothetical protein
VVIITYLQQFLTEGNSPFFAYSAKYKKNFLKTDYTT